MRNANEPSQRGGSPTPYSAGISRANPSAIVLLIDQSDRMRAQVAWGARDSKTEVATGLLNRILSEVIIRCTMQSTAGEFEVRDYFEICVISIGSAIIPALPGAARGRWFVGVSDVAQSVLRVDEIWGRRSSSMGGVEQRIKVPIWVNPEASGEARLCAGLQTALGVIERWIDEHPSAYPPTLLLIAGGAASDGDPTQPAERITRLSTDDGPVQLCVAYIPETLAAPVFFPSSAADMPEDARMLFQLASEIPGPRREHWQTKGFTLSDRSRGMFIGPDVPLGVLVPQR